MNSIVFLIFSSVLFYGCRLYIDDLQNSYVERDGIYQISNNQESIHGDIFYSSFFNKKRYKLENISSKDDFVVVKKDTMYKDFLAINYYGYSSQNLDNNIKNDSTKLKYNRDEIYYSGNEDVYKKNNNVKYYGYDNVDFVIYDFSDVDYDLYNNFDSHYFQYSIYENRNRRRNSNKKNIIINNNNSINNQREKRSYEEFRQKNINNNNIRNEKEYNIRSTNRRRR